jgi:PII-like signaling protein
MSATREVTMVHIYLTEQQHLLEKIMGLLHDQEKVAGVTVFRGITGFGRSGQMHSSALLDMSLDLPLVIEFFDEPGRIGVVMDHLRAYVKPGHMVSWQAHVYE